MKHGSVESKQEELNCCYVAWTRAKQRLIFLKDIFAVRSVSEFEDEAQLDDEGDLPQGEYCKIRGKMRALFKTEEGPESPTLPIRQQQPQVPAPNHKRRPHQNGGGPNAYAASGNGATLDGSRNVTRRIADEM